MATSSVGKQLPLALTGNLTSSFLQFLDAREIARTTRVCKTWRKTALDIYAVALTFAKQVDGFRRTQDLYPLLAMDLPAGLRADAQKVAAHALKMGMKAALEPHTFVDPLAHCRVKDPATPVYRLIKITGADYREARRRALDPLDLCHLSAPTRPDICGLFKMTECAARTLGEIVSEDTCVNALIVYSCRSTNGEFCMPNRAPEHDPKDVKEKSFNDKVAITLLHALPPERLQCFYLSGGFGAETMQEYIKQMPRLHDHLPRLDSRDISILPLLPIEEEEYRGYDKEIARRFWNWGAYHDEFEADCSVM